MMKKRKFGAGGMPTPADRAASKAQDAMLKKAPATRPELAAAKSGNRVNKQESAEARKMGLKKGGKASCYAKGGSVTRADGIARKGKTKGRYI
jgi:hypothetical protein